ncbi:MAG: anti-sigma factor [Methylobacterium sp.]|uniref:NepR family anti-sigma factor n=1 Tax=Methylobacterium sp. TaxID=409 RepID=UPI0025EA391C|nr:NepR family anti-sigma factor [Methylobacterium sp.]MBX9932891.1 anti-sigma factor [Methylobacterium sp.]
MDQDGTAGGLRRKSGARPSGDDAVLNDLTQKRIGLHLRTMYDAVVQQPIPDRFRDLIARLDTADPEPSD